MPRSIPRPCRKTNCARTTTDRRGYCEAHKSESWDRHHQGKTAAQRGYGAAWRRLRDRIMERDQWLCQECLKENRITPAHAVDHILPKSQGGTDAEHNLSALCMEHHNSKTHREAMAGRA